MFLFVYLFACLPVRLLVLVCWLCSSACFIETALKPFSSRLAAYSAFASSTAASSASSYATLPPPMDHDASNPFLLPTSTGAASAATEPPNCGSSNVFSDLFSDPALCPLDHPLPRRNTPLLDLQAASGLPGGKIQVKGKATLLLLLQGNQINSILGCFVFF